MGLLSGLEKFGVKADSVENVYQDAKSEKQQGQGAQEKAQQEKVPQEKDFLLEKTVRCPICDHSFKSMSVKSNARRLESDDDLRPRFQYIDTIKYDLFSCPFCGYTALQKYFDHISPTQAKLIRENICASFKPQEPKSGDELVLNYEEAIERYKLSLYNTIVKKGPTSERAYTCLRTAWLLRGYRESVTGDSDHEKGLRYSLENDEKEFYSEAFDGFVKALSSENLPMCGMDESTLDYLLANMAYRLEKYDMASRFVSSILTSRTAPGKIKDKALDLKTKIVASLRG